MSAKRQPATDSSSNPAKRTKTTQQSPVDDIPRDPRWSKVSASANADMEFKRIIARDPEKTYCWRCLCKARFFGLDDDSEDESEDEEPKDGEEVLKPIEPNIEWGTNPQSQEKKIPCDGKTCPCSKPLTSYPGHPWVLTFAGMQRLYTTAIQSNVRDPDSMGMYTYNDHFGYGLRELVENILIDFDAAKDDWQQWSICEAMIMFFVRGIADPMFMIDDGEGLQLLVEVIKAMFLSMLATLERNNLLKPDSDVKNLGQIMSLYIRWAADTLPEASMDPKELEDLVLAYATKHKIELAGLSVMKTDRVQLQERADKLKLPQPTDKENDPWGWKKIFKDYKQDYGPIGGDKLDLTTWSSAERKKHSFDKKDPLDKKMIDALKQGLVIQLA